MLMKQNLKMSVSKDNPLPLEGEGWEEGETERIEECCVKRI